MAIACLMAACSKKNDPDTPPVEEKIISRIMAEKDTVRFVYNAERMVTQVHEYGMDGTNPYHDSLQVVYEGGKVGKFRIWFMEELRNDRTFEYSGAQLVRINYYNMVGPDELAITDHDSLVYKNGKLAEFHRIYGNVRSAVTKLTWDQDNVIKAEGYSVNQETETLEATVIYTYNDKPGLSANFADYFMFLHGDNDFSALSANGVLTEETKLQPGDIVFTQSTYTYTFGATGWLEKAVVATQLPATGGTESNTINIDYTTIE